MWAGTAGILEIPSGALADRLSRRRLLAVAVTLRCACFGLWVAAPSFPAFAAGFVLWSAKSALTSGTLEALVYDELTAAGAAERYGGLLGRAEAARGAATLIATAAAAPLLEMGSYPLVAAASMLVCLAQIPAALYFPTVPRMTTTVTQPPAIRAYLATLKAGVREVLGRPELRSAVLVAAIPVLVIDEYLALLARDVGVPAAEIPLLILVPMAVGTLASLVVGTGRWKAVAAPVTATAVLVAGGAIWAGWAAVPGVVMVGLGIGVYRLGLLVIQARIQHAVAGQARATVTSVAGFLTESGGVAAFAVFGVGSRWLGLPGLFLADAILIAGVAAYARLVLQRRRSGR